MRIDLNADVGEGYDDESLFPYVTSVNIACGGHAGDDASMSAAVASARRFGLSVGAHPSYPDREHFGRRTVAIPEADLERSLTDQIATLARIAATEHVELAHVKPHGALYNLAARDLGTARLIARAVRGFGPRLGLVGLAGSRLLEAARELELPAFAEAFADRRYAADGSLAPRTLASAVVEDPEAAAEQALRIVRDREVSALDGTVIRISADTLCVHGDTPHAAAIARTVRDRLRDAGVAVSAR
ncbi:MAG: 5-oxoprolinase subunit PxpA [Candidatus Binatia bacterium]